MSGKAGTPPNVTIVIPTLNEADHIASVIKKLVDGDQLACASEIIVADGGSTDGTQEIVKGLMPRFPRLRLLHNPGKTQARALNMMLSEEFAWTDILIRCDAHAAYPERYISRLVDCLEQTGAASVVVPMDAQADIGCFQHGLAWIADTRLGAGGSPHRGGKLSGWVDHGHHAAFRMAKFRTLGGYDVDFLANEDAEYDCRVLTSGGRIWLESSIRIGYFPRRTPRKLWQQYFRYGQGRAKTCRKHGLRPAARQMIPVGHVLLLGGALLSLSLTPFGLLYPGFYGIAVGSAGLWVATSRRNLCGLAATPALAIMHMAWGLGFLIETVRCGKRTDKATVTA